MCVGEREKEREKDKYITFRGYLKVDIQIHLGRLTVSLSGERKIQPFCFSKIKSKSHFISRQ